MHAACCPTLQAVLPPVRCHLEDTHLTPPTSPIPTRVSALVQLYAVYGGFFILLSYLWGWAVDGDRPDVGDWVGTAIAMVGVCLAFFWPGR